MNSLFNRFLIAWRIPASAVKMVSFALIGLANTAIDGSVFAIAYKLLALPLIASNILSWCVAVCCSYLMNSKITFRRETNGVFKRKDFLRFVGSGVFGLIVTTTTLLIFSQYTSVLVAKCISIVVAFAVNFSMSHFVIFRSLQPGKAAD